MINFLNSLDFHDSSWSNPPILYILLKLDFHGHDWLQNPKVKVWLLGICVDVSIESTNFKTLESWINVEHVESYWGPWNDDIDNTMSDAILKLNLETLILKYDEFNGLMVKKL